MRYIKRLKNLGFEKVVIFSDLIHWGFWWVYSFEAVMKNWQQFFGEKWGLKS